MLGHKKAHQVTLVVVTLDVFKLAKNVELKPVSLQIKKGVIS